MFFLVRICWSFFCFVFVLSVLVVDFFFATTFKTVEWNKLKLLFWQTLFIWFWFIYFCSHNMTRILNVNVKNAVVVAAVSFMDKLIYQIHTHIRTFLFYFFFWIVTSPKTRLLAKDIVERFQTFFSSFRCCCCCNSWAMEMMMMMFISNCVQLS